MSKSLVAILHYNSTQYTDVLYELLKPYEGNDYDLIVIDNGSDIDKTSKYSTFRLDRNTYYGGGLDITMDYFINNPQYDSMLLLNSDIIVHGYNFIKSLRKELFSPTTNKKLMAISGCVLQPEKNQCHWKAIHNWGFKKVRYVPWVDFQCILLKRELVETIGAFESNFGWVQDVMTGIICEDNDWKIGVCDWAPVIHFSNGTVKDNIDDPIIFNYNKHAEIEMINYFKERNLWDRFIEMRQKAENYNAYYE